ncbi:MAG: hypothetical protein M0031_02410 [Thermaerobacter sp.]|nr:hypothetical protein [Thermaerobacter sp.]
MVLVPEAQLVNPYWLERRWNAVKYRFADLHDREGDLAECLLVMEHQAAFMATRDARLTDEDIGQAYMLAGMQVAMAIDPQLNCRFEGFEGPVAELSQRCLAACHPDFNPEVATVAEQEWTTPQDRIDHFMIYGAVFRRLVSSVKFWGRHGPRGYVQFVTRFLDEGGLDYRADVIHFTVVGKPPGNGRGGSRLIASRRRV